MGSSSVNPSDYITPPDNTNALSLLSNFGQSGANALANQNALLVAGSKMPYETYNPDLFGPVGAGNEATQMANIAAFRNRQLEQQNDPSAYAARQALSKAAEQDVSPEFWQKQMDEWARTKGLQNSLQTGTAPTSSFGQSAFADAATPQGMAFRNANLAQAQQLIGNAPKNAYIDPAAAIAAQQAAQAQSVQARNARNAAVLGASQGINQSNMDWINSLMGSTSSALNANNKNWQNYQQAMLQGAVNNAASQNAMSGNLLNTAGTLGSAYLQGMGGFGGAGAGAAAAGAGAGAGEAGMSSAMVDAAMMAAEAAA